MRTEFSYQLITSERSPFGRICRMFMHAHKIDFDLRILNFVDEAEAAKQLAKETPINRVPILVDDEQKIFDSRVIIGHLMEKHGIPRLTLEEENIVTSVYSAMDASVALFLMQKDGFDLNQPGFYLRRQLARIPTNLEYVTPWAGSLDAKNPLHWNYASMSLYSYLEWADKRSRRIKIGDHPRLEAFYRAFSHAPGVPETALN